MEQSISEGAKRTTIPRNRSRGDSPLTLSFLKGTFTFFLRYRGQDIGLIPKLQGMVIALVKALLNILVSERKTTQVEQSLSSFLL